MPQGSKILIVEDEMIISMEIKQKLLGMGYLVVGQAITGESAIQKAGEAMPDLILMDIRLKGDMDGITAANRIMNLYDIPIIFLTAHSDKATLERAISVSPSGYLLKPFKERELMTNIEMSLHKHRVRQKLKEESSPPTSSGVYKDLAMIPLPLLSITRTGLIEFINPAALQMSGYVASELVNKPFTALIGGPKISHDSLTSSDTLKNRVVMPDQMVLIRQSGEEVPISMSVGQITGETDDETRFFLMIKGDETTDSVVSHLVPGMIQHLMLICDSLKFSAFVIDKHMQLCGYNKNFAHFANKVGINTYMLNRPIFETPHFSIFADMQDLQEIFKSGDGDVRIRKFKTDDEVTFIRFSRIPMKKDGVTTHIATILTDVTSEQRALYEVEKIKHVIGDLFNALEKLRILSQEIRGPFHQMIKKICDEQEKTGIREEEWMERLSQLMNDLDIAWIQYAQARDQVKKN